MRYDVENNNFCNLYYIFKEFTDVTPSIYSGGFKKKNISLED